MILTLSRFASTLKERREITDNRKNRAKRDERESKGEKRGREERGWY
jgi:hypothetical protein